MPPRVTSSSGPSQPQEALAWIKEAIRESRYRTTGHLLARIAARQIILDEVLYVLRHGQRVEPYAEPPQHGGTSWRLHGRDSAGRQIAVGVEAYLDEQQRWAILCTVINTNRRGR